MTQLLFSFSEYRFEPSRLSLTSLVVLGPHLHTDMVFMIFKLADKMIEAADVINCLCNYGIFYIIMLAFTFVVKKKKRHWLKLS